jgi:DNA-binding CsgD family transcriptional regulator
MITTFIRILSDLRIGTLLCGLLLVSELAAQGVNIGTPPVWNYPRKTYKAGTQNWDATQDEQGRMYFANNDGLLRFDGATWQTFPVRNHTIVRSVAIDPSGRIFTGAQSEIGYFSPSPNGTLSYTSLVGELPADKRSFEDVWDIAFHEGRTYFRTYHHVYEYSDGGFQIYETTLDLVAMFVLSEGVVVQRSDFSLWFIKNKRFHPLDRIESLQSAVTGAFPWHGDTTLLSSLKNGIMYSTPHGSGRWNTAADDLLITNRIYSGTLLPNNQLALGTSLDGLVVIDEQRRVVRHLNKRHGLQNNNVLAAFCDHERNVWLGLDNGIDCVVLDSRFTTVFPDIELQATGYNAVMYNDRLYLGVSNGAFVAPWKNYYDPEGGPIFQRVGHSEGQVWGFSALDHHLMMGHHEGAFEINNASATHIYREPGTWTYIQLDEQHLMAGMYSGLGLYKLVNGTWQFDRKINGIAESCRIMIRDDAGTIWISHPYRGLYKVDWNVARPYDPDIIFYDASSGLPTNLNNYVFAISGKAVFGTEKGVYQYLPDKKRFAPDPDYNALIGEDHRVRRMCEDKQGNIWYVSDQEVGMLDVHEFGIRKEVTKRVFPELAEKLVGGFEFIYPLDEHNVFFGAEEGFIHYDVREVDSTLMTVQLVFNSITARKQLDTLLSGGYANADSTMAPITLDADFNNLSFSYAATEFSSPHLVEYSTRLVGLEENWSPWSVDTRRDFTGLAPGTYTFEVKAQIRNGVQSDVIRYAFQIYPPWYKSRLAMMTYGIGVLGFFAGFIMRQRRKFETEKARLEVTHQAKEAQHMLAVEQSKAALDEVQNAKLEAEVKFKNQELASTTMHLVQKAEILLSVQEGLNRIQEKAENPAARKEIQQLLNLINFDVKVDEDWAHFAHHFDRVHVDFLKHLREHFPQLSSNDLKLCAYLRMNLSTKEIAPLMNISVRGVEGSRYRLRRKLDLPNDANLTEFILGLEV